MGEGYGAIQRGEGCLCSRGGDSLVTHSAGSVTTQSIAFKYVVVASESYGYTWYSKQVMEGLQNIKIYFFKTLEIQMFLSSTNIFLESQQNFRRFAKN